MDTEQEKVLEALAGGPKTAWWLARETGLKEAGVGRALAGLLSWENVDGASDPLVEARGSEYLYPQVDRRDGVRHKRGGKYRLRTWTETRTYFALTPLGHALIPLKYHNLGKVEK